MEVTPKTQIAELIRSSNNPLILTHQDPDGDAIGSALALHLALKKLNKTAEVVFVGELPESLNFLPAINEAQSEVKASNDLLITIDTRATGEDLKLGQKKETDEHRVVIAVSPERGSLLPEDVTISRAKPKYDLVVMVDTSSPELLGPVYTELPALFYETPTASIDHHPTNNHFAKVNWVDMTATSTAEMMVALIESLGRNESLLDADIATLLLTGLLTDTNSFQNANTTPKSLTVAAQLIAAGARKQEIVEKVFQTRKFSTLKLWGKALANLREDTSLKFAWTSLSLADAEAVGAASTSTGGFVDDLLKTVSGADFVLLLKEKENEVRGSLRSVTPNFNVAEIAKLFGGGGHLAAAGFVVAGKLGDNQAEILDKIRAELNNRPASATGSASLV